MRTLLLASRGAKAPGARRWLKGCACRSCGARLPGEVALSEDPPADGRGAQGARVVPCCCPDGAEIVRRKDARPWDRYGGPKGLIKADWRATAARCSPDGGAGSAVAGLAGAGVAAAAALLAAAVGGCRRL